MHSTFCKVMSSTVSRTWLVDASFHSDALHPRNPLLVQESACRRILSCFYLDVSTQTIMSCTWSDYKHNKGVSAGHMVMDAFQVILPACCCPLTVKEARKLVKKETFAWPTEQDLFQFATPARDDTYSIPGIDDPVDANTPVIGSVPQSTPEMDMTPAFTLAMDMTPQAIHAIDMTPQTTCVIDLTCETAMNIIPQSTPSVSKPAPSRRRKKTLMSRPSLLEWKLSMADRVWPLPHAVFERYVKIAECLHVLSQTPLRDIRCAEHRGQIAPRLQECVPGQPFYYIEHLMQWMCLMIHRYGYVKPMIYPSIVSQWGPAECLLASKHTMTNVTYMVMWPFRVQTQPPYALEVWVNHTRVKTCPMDLEKDWNVPSSMAIDRCSPAVMKKINS